MKKSIGGISGFALAATRILPMAGALAAGAVAAQGAAKATFAGGCLWRIEPPSTTTAGYMGFYRSGCGRDERPRELWGEPGD
jgi:hypothetical protein